MKEGLTPAPTAPASSEYSSFAPGLLAYPLDAVTEYPRALPLETDMAENVRLAARGRDGPAAEKELNSIAAGPVGAGTKGVRARNLNVRVTDGNMLVVVCLRIYERVMEKACGSKSRCIV